MLVVIIVKYHVLWKKCYFVKPIIITIMIIFLIMCPVLIVHLASLQPLFKFNLSCLFQEVELYVMNAARRQPPVDASSATRTSAKNAGASCTKTTPRARTHTTGSKYRCKLQLQFLIISRLRKVIFFFRQPFLGQRAIMIMIECNREIIHDE